MGSTLAQNTYILCFDVESNGLHGEAFAVAGILRRLDGLILEEFSGRCKPPIPLNQWVVDNVLPVLDGPSGIPVNHSTPGDLRDAFWGWYKHCGDLAKLHGQRIITIADFGIPVESNFLSACVADNLDDREWGLPYPTHELATLLLACGYDPDVNREQLAEAIGHSRTPRKHDPRWDVFASCHVALYCFSKLRTKPSR